MGDWADSSSSFSALSCCIGAHPWISASCRHSSSTLRTSGAAARAAPPARAYLRSFALSHVRPFIQSARESTHTDTTKGVFSDTIDVPTESVAASATRSSVRRQERRLDMVVDGGKRDWQWAMAGTRDARRHEQTPTWGCPACDSESDCFNFPQVSTIDRPQIKSFSDHDHNACLSDEVRGCCHSSGRKAHGRHDGKIRPLARRVPRSVSPSLPRLLSIKYSSTRPTCSAARPEDRAPARAYRVGDPTRRQATRPPHD